MPDSRLLRHILRTFRKRRMNLFQQVFRVSEQTRVLDVGGSPEIWDHAPVRPNLTIVNLPSAIERLDRVAAQVAADGCMLPFRDRAFDIVFSNSVIEHVGNIANQQRFSREVARVGRHYWVQTPNRGFPIEQHLLLPFVHHLPLSWRPPIVKRFTGWELIARPSPAQREYYIHHFLHELRLLNASDLQGLFPDSRLLSEKVFGLTKSLIAVRS